MLNNKLVFKGYNVYIGSQRKNLNSLDKEEVKVVLETPLLLTPSPCQFYEKNSLSNLIIHPFKVGNIIETKQPNVKSA